MQRILFLQVLKFSEIVVLVEVYLSMETTPSDFDDIVAEKFRIMTEQALFEKYLMYLNEMNNELVFSGIGHEQNNFVIV